MLISMETKREFNKTLCAKKVSYAESLRFSKKLIICFYFFLKKENEKEKEQNNLVLEKQREGERFSDLMKSMRSMENIFGLDLRPFEVIHAIL